MTETNSDLDAANVEAAKILVGNQIQTTVSADARVVRCQRCRRELSSPRSITHGAGRQCRLLLAQEAVAC